MSATKKLNLFAWSLSLAVAVIAFVTWGQDSAWHFAHLSSYQFFPLFGLLAFSLMWSHYIVSVARQYLKVDKTLLHVYVETTSVAVLIALFLHPGLLLYQLWRDGFGLPPGSFLHHYVATGMGWIALIGFVSWFVFMAYEFRRKFGQRSWWHYIGILTDIAMVGIFYHGLRLGSQTQSGWFYIVWWFYGLTLIGALAFIYINKYRPAKIKK